MFDALLTMAEQDSPPSQCVPEAPPSVVAVPAPRASSSPPLVSSLRRTPKKPMGLGNPTGSSCYLNSVLQCLTFTPPLAKYCRRQVHSTNCMDRRCIMCILEKRIRRSLEAAVNSETPRNLSTHVTTQSALFQPGRHEDAHELLSFLIDKCGKAFQGPGTPVLEKLFGGVLQSQIECRQCNAASTKHEDMLDLSLNIRESESLAQALACFFDPEILDGDNKYHCDGCNSVSVAQKLMSIHEMPKVLLIQMQRFDPLSGNKLGHFVQFEDQLSVTNYITQKFTAGSVPYYKLYAVIEHEGNSRQRGHYLAAVKETNGKWYVCDDEEVSEIKLDNVLQSRAYLLFYIRCDVTEDECL